MLEPLIVEKSRPVLIVGYGYMAKDYLPALQGEGFSDKDIFVVDINEKQLTLCNNDYPEIYTTTSLKDALEKSPKTIFNLVNTPSHFKIVEQSYKAGVRNHFVEKPLTFTVTELEKLEKMIPLGYGSELKIHVGYLINFSPAVAALIEMMKTLKLIVREARGFWGKDRTNNVRPTPGDLEDEMTHPLNTMLNLVLCNQKIEEMQVQGAISNVSFASDEAQGQACMQDPSFPQKPTATSHVAVRLSTNHISDILMTVHSSFISFAQKRFIELNLSPMESPERPTCIAEILFDVNGKDYLRFKEAGAKKIDEFEFSGSNKLQDQVHAFLRYAAGETPDTRLTHFHQAAFMVRLTDAILKSEKMIEVM